MPAAASAPLAPGARRGAIALLLITLLALVLWSASEQITDADLWWAMAAGRYIVEQGSVPYHDVFSYTYQGAPWANQEWGSQVLFYEIFRLGGGTAVALSKFALVIATFVLVTWVGWRRSGSLLLAVAAAGVAALICRPFLDIRSQLFLFLGSMSVLAIHEAYRAGARPRILALLPVMMTLWVNLHFSFIFGIGLAGLLATAEIAKSWLGLPGTAMPLRRSLAFGGAAAIAILACLVNPDHVHALIFPFGILGDDSSWRGKIIEWLPPVLFSEQIANPATFGYLLVGQAVVAAVALASAPRRFDIGDFAAVAVTAVMALQARRFIPLFALVAAPFLANNLALVCARFPGATSVLQIRARRAAIAVAALCVVTLGLLTSRFVPYARETFAQGLFEGLIYADFFPAHAVDFLKRNPLPGRLFHLYTWAGYVMYWLPERQVFIDGRAHTVYPLRFYEENEIAQYGYRGWEDVLDRYGVSVILWPSGFAGGRHAVMRDQLLGSPHWKCVYDDGHSAVFAHVERGREWIERYDSFALVYPEIAEAQLFLANAYLAANEYERAREHIRATMRRYPQTVANWDEVETELAKTARSTGEASAWFGVGFFRDIHDDPKAASAAFHAALEAGLDDASARYARQALARLGSPG